MRLLITDVTEMHDGNYCVAGWCADENRMVRPLPNGANWTAFWLRMDRVFPGATVQVQPVTKPLHNAYPHRMEDTPIDPLSVQMINPGPEQWFGPNAPPAASTLVEAFESKLAHTRVWNGVCRGVHVPSGTKVRSLWAVRVDSNRLSFEVDEYDGKRKLKAILHDGVARYKLAVSSKILKESWRAEGLAAINQRLPKPGLFHVRVGLARAWADQPDKCYVMVNGVYW